MHIGTVLARTLGNRLRLTRSKSQKQNSTDSSRSPDISSLGPTPKFDLSCEDLSKERLTKVTTKICQRRPAQQQLLEEILQKVAELEHTLYEDQQQEFKLRMALERQNERIDELNFLVDTEKQRNERLIQLLRGVDTDSDDESEPELISESRVFASKEIFESMSPLLMMQRIDELTNSNREFRRLMSKQDKTIKLLNCKIEQLKGKCDHLFDEYRSEQKRTQIVCNRHLQMKFKKNQEIQKLRNALTYSSECISIAQLTINDCSNYVEPRQLKKFDQHLDCFLHAVRHCCSQRRLAELQQQQDEEKTSAATVSNSSGNCTLVPARRGSG